MWLDPVTTETAGTAATFLDVMTPDVARWGSWQERTPTTADVMSCLSFWIRRDNGEPVGLFTLADLEDSWAATPHLLVMPSAVRDVLRAGVVEGALQQLGARLGLFKYKAVTNARQKQTARWLTLHGFRPCGVYTGEAVLADGARSDLIYWERIMGTMQGSAV